MKENMSRRGFLGSSAVLAGGAALGIAGDLNYRKIGQRVDGFQKVCRTVVFAELDWSPGGSEQCMGRVFRDGAQIRPATYWFDLKDVRRVL